MNKRLTLLVSGKVQGVFFRVNTVQLAQKLGLVGFVQNLPNGQVKIVAEGPEEKLIKLNSWARGGSPSAQVNGLSPKFSKAVGQFNSFEIRR